MKTHDGITIGLFGTCDNVPWRIPFMEEYNQKRIKYFNPDAGDNWHAGMIEEENYYLNNAEIILFPILKESLGSGSLGEIGFSVQNVLRNIQNGKQQFLISLIDDDCTDERKTDEERKRSIKDRKLVKSKLKENVSCPVITIVNTLDDMMVLSMQLYEFLSQGCPAEEQSKTG
ncbi:MAG: hypothetical protein ACTSX1_03465 [Candidatus Heimdallarchaeaceae archaeon]